jgi:hypothetical protein
MTLITPQNSLVTYESLVAKHKLALSAVTGFPKEAVEMTAHMLAGWGFAMHDQVMRKGGFDPQIAYEAVVFAIANMVADFSRNVGTDTETKRNIAFAIIEDAVANIGNTFDREEQGKIKPVLINNSQGEASGRG